MAEAARRGTPGGMLAVGSDRAGAESLSSEHGLVLANENSPEQFVLSGPLEGIEAAHAAKSSGIRAKRLAVAGAFHTAAMKPGVEPFRAALEEIGFNPSEAPSSPRRPPTAFRGRKGFPRRILTSPIRWTAVTRKLRDLGVTRYLDVGPGKVLAGLVRRTIEESEIETLASRERALPELASRTSKWTPRWSIRRA